MNTGRQNELKKRYLQRLGEAGYSSVKDLIRIQPPTLMNIIGSTINTAEKLYIAALKKHLKQIQIEFNGASPNGITPVLNEAGYWTIKELGDVNPAIISKILKVSPAGAGEIVMFAMELSLGAERLEKKTKRELVQQFEQEVSHQLAKIERNEQKQQLHDLVENSVKKIQSTIKLPAEEVSINKQQKEEIIKLIEQFTTVFPACVGFVIYNKRGEGMLKFVKDKRAEKTLLNIHESIPNTLWKISLALEEKDEYGWINSPPHLVWIEALRDRKQRRQLAYVGLFIFESEAKEGVGTATPTIKGIVKEIERIIYGKIP